MGFLGLGNYAKPGKGVKKGEPEKKRFFQFFDLYGRKFKKLIQLNLLFAVFCLPSILLWMLSMFLVEFMPNNDTVLMVFTMVFSVLCLGLTGPAIAAMMKIVRYYNEEKSVFLMSDYWKAYKENFKQSLLMGFINAILIFVIYQAFMFYYVKTFESGWYWIPMGIIVLLTVIAIFANFYTYLVIVCVNLRFFSVLRNSISFAFLGAKTNFLTLFFVLLVLIPSALFYPLTLPVLLLLTFSTMSMIVGFNSFQYVYKFSIKPYYVMNGLENPYEKEEEEEDPIFEDATV